MFSPPPLPDPLNIMMRVYNRNITFIHKTHFFLCGIRQTWIICTQVKQTMQCRNGVMSRLWGWSMVLNICFTFLLLFTGMHLCVTFGSSMWPWKVETNIDYIQITSWLGTAPQDSQNIKKEGVQQICHLTGIFFRGRIFCEIAHNSLAGFVPIFSEFTLHLKACT